MKSSIPNNNRPADTPSFGSWFGRLVRSRRGIEGWTQEELAIQAFDDPSRKSLISSLENGRVPNPQQKTIDALSVALGIEADELSRMSSKWLSVQSITEYDINSRLPVAPAKIRKIVARMNLADAISQLANQLKDETHLLRSIELYEATLEQAKEINAQDIQAEIWTRLGSALRTYSDKQESVKYSRKAIYAFEQAMRIIDAE
jgi:transcriptional regulator with XRE-family HTH domain